MNQSGGASSVLPSGAIPQRMEPPRRHHVDEDAFVDLEDGFEFDPVKLFWFAVHYRWIIAATMACCLVAGVMVTWMQTPMYRAQTTLEILAPSVKVLDEIDTVATISDLRAFETARSRILSRDLARRVVFELNLGDDARFLAPVPSFSLMNIFRRAFGMTGTVDLDAMSPAQREARATGLVRSGLSASLLRNTSIVSVTYEHADPQTAARVVNQVASSYINQAVDRRSETSSLARDFIQEQVIEVQERLEESERALVDYAEAEGITLDANESSLIVANINEINTRLTDALQGRLELERYVAQIEAGAADSLPQVFESSSIQDAQRRVIELRAEYQQRSATLRPGFPEMRRLQAQIDELTSQTNRQIGAIASSVRLQLEQANVNIASLRSELANLEERQSEFRRKNIGYTILQREVDSNREQYQSLIGKLNDVVVGADLRTANAAIVDEAVAPGGPFAPRPMRNLALAFVLAGLIAAAIIYIVELLNNTFAVPDQIEADLKLPVLGIIPRVRDGYDDAIMDPSSNVSEAHRTLRTSLQFTSAYKDTKTLLITSADPYEGKTWTAFKLAQEFAALNRKVLVIDADLRRPRMHRLFKSDNAIGLSNILTNMVRDNIRTPVFRKSKVHNVDFMTSGTLPPSPADLLASDRMGMVLHFCKTRYDLVIIDAPPVMGLSDAAILSRLADTTLMVVSAKQVKRRSAQNAVKRLRAVGGHVVGAVMTKFEIERLDYNYAYRYMNYGYYAYGSHLEDQSKEAGRVDASASDHVVGRVMRDLRRRFG